MYATVVAVDGDDVVLEVAPGIEVRYMKRAIMDVVSPGETYEPEEEPAEEDPAADEPADEPADDIEAEAPQEQDDSESAAYEKATGSKKD